MNNTKERIYQAFKLERFDSAFGSIDANKKRWLEFGGLSFMEQLSIDSYYESFLVRFTYNSNTIEGSTLTLSETAFVLDGEFVSDKPARDQFAARGIFEGAEYARTHFPQNGEITEQYIRDIHERTALDCQPAIRGMYRTSPVYIRGSNAVPVDFYMIRENLADLLYAYNNSSAHPVAKASAFHAMFENIHPFIDGNGRCGRIILNEMLSRAGYPPIAIKADTKNLYMRALENWQINNNPEEFLEIVASCIETEQRTLLGIIEQTRDPKLKKLCQGQEQDRTSIRNMGDCAHVAASERDEKSDISKNSTIGR